MRADRVKLHDHCDTLLLVFHLRQFPAHRRGIAVLRKRMSVESEDECKQDVDRVEVDWCATWESLRAVSLVFRIDNVAARRRTTAEIYSFLSILQTTQRGRIVLFTHCHA
jgi:hypothetical protein